jgi:hypothetical protein
MSEDEFMLTTPAFFASKVKAKERQRQHEYELARWISFWAVFPHAKKGSVKNPQSLARFTWEKATNDLTKEQLEIVYKRLEEEGKKEWGEDYKLKMVGRDDR